MQSAASRYEVRSRIPVFRFLQTRFPIATFRPQRPSLRSARTQAARQLTPMFSSSSNLPQMLSPIIPAHTPNLPLNSTIPVHMHTPRGGGVSPLACLELRRGDNTAAPHLSTIDPISWCGGGRGSAGAAGPCRSRCRWGCALRSGCAAGWAFWDPAQISRDWRDAGGRIRSA
jgi:hypothetical protein